MMIRQLTVRPGSKFLSDSFSNISTGNTLIREDPSLFTARLAIELTVPENMLSEKASGFTSTFNPLLIFATSTSLIRTVAFNEDKSGSCINGNPPQHWSPIWNLLPLLQLCDKMAIPEEGVTTDNFCSVSCASSRRD